VAAFDETELGCGVGSIVAREGTNRVGPGAGRVDDDAGSAGFAFTFGVESRDPSIFSTLQSRDAGAGADDGAAIRGQAGVQDHETGIVNPAIPVAEGVAHVRAEHLAGRIVCELDRAGPRNATALGKVIIEEQAGAEFKTGARAGSLRHHEA
jgi:hypothetical protein